MEGSRALMKQIQRCIVSWWLCEIEFCWWCITITTCSSEGSRQSSSYLISHIYTKFHALLLCCVTYILSCFSEFVLVCFVLFVLFHVHLSSSFFLSENFSPVKFIFERISILRSLKGFFCATSLRWCEHAMDLPFCCFMHNYDNYAQGFVVCATLIYAAIGVKHNHF